MGITVLGGVTLLGHNGTWGVRAVVCGLVSLEDVSCIDFGIYVVEA